MQYREKLRTSTKNGIASSSYNSMKISTNRKKKLKKTNNVVEYWAGMGRGA
jgi:hypothetical protein